MLHTLAQFFPSDFQLVAVPISPYPPGKLTTSLDPPLSEVKRIRVLFSFPAFPIFPVFCLCSDPADQSWLHILSWFCFPRLFLHRSGCSSRCVLPEIIEYFGEYSQLFLFFKPLISRSPHSLQCNDSYIFQYPLARPSKGHVGQCMRDTGKKVFRV